MLGVGADTGCSVPSVLLFFDRQRFLFNAGEGFQRFCVEHRVKLAKVSAVLATRTTTEATGGLPGECQSCSAGRRAVGRGWCDVASRWLPLARAWRLSPYLRLAVMPGSCRVLFAGRACLPCSISRQPSLYPRHAADHG